MQAETFCFLAWAECADSGEEQEKTGRWGVGNNDRKAPIMRLEPICTNAADDVGGGVRAAISEHRRKMCDLVNFTRDCDENRRTDSSSVMRLERLSKDEQIAMTAVAETSVLSADDRRVKAMYLAELLEADPECLKPEDLVAALRSLA